jgi:hypothetical protein
MSETVNSLLSRRLVVAALGEGIIKDTHLRKAIARILFRGCLLVFQQTLGDDHAIAEHASR